MTDWSEQVRRQIHLVFYQAMEMQSRVESASRDKSLEMHLRILEEMFSNDLRLAELRDNSDLLLRVEGTAFHKDIKLHIVSSVFENVTHQVTDLTKAILGLGSEGKVTPKSVDLSLSGIARGSLFFGLKAVTGETKDGGRLLGQSDPLYASTRHALKVIDDIAHTIEVDPDHVSIEKVSEIVDDPRVRDAALVAVQRLAPSGRLGFDSVSVSGSGSNLRPAELVAAHRKSIRNSLQKPVVAGYELELLGQVREIDLDSRRFDLRGITNEQISVVRCAYRNLENVNPKQLLGASVRVRGLVERTADDTPRLMSITNLEITHPAPDEL